MEKTYNHIVPATYQKRWHTHKGKKNVYYFDKTLNLINVDGGNVDDNMGIDRYYILTQQDIDLINQRIADTGDSDFVFDPTIVENYFDKAVESHWKYVLELFEDGGKIIDKPIRKHFEENIAKNPNGLGIKAKDLIGLKSPEWLKDFIITQRIRCFENVKERIIQSVNISKRYIQRISGEIIDAVKAELDKSLKDEGFLRSLWLASLIDSQKGKDISWLTTIKNILGYKFTCVAIFTNKMKFILSDNPVVYNIGEGADKKLGGGYYMPISPNTLIAFLDCSKWGAKPEEILLFRANDEFVKYINRKLLNQAYEKVGFCNLNIACQIASPVCTNTGMKEMFNLTD